MRGPQRWVTVEEVAGAGAVSRRQVYRWIASGQVLAERRPRPGRKPVTVVLEEELLQEVRRMRRRRE
jgi:hypothetical protein